MIFKLDFTYISNLYIKCAMSWHNTHRAYEMNQLKWSSYNCLHRLDGLELGGLIGMEDQMTYKKLRDFSAYLMDQSLT